MKQTYAVKIVNTKYKKAIMAERSVLSQVNLSPYCVRLVSFLEFQNCSLFYMEYLEKGSLAKLLKKKGRLPEAAASFCSAEISEAIFCLHSQGIIHRDLKIDNIMFDNEGHVKVIDFGQAKTEVTIHSVIKDNYGYVKCLAPEVISGEGYNFSCDIWTMGIVLYQMLTGLDPFCIGDSEKSLTYEKIFYNIICVEPWYPDELSRKAQVICRQLLRKDPNKRLGCGETGKADFQASPFFWHIDWHQIKDRSGLPPIWEKDSEDIELPPEAQNA